MAFLRRMRIQPPGLHAGGGRGFPRLPDDPGCLRVNLSGSLFLFPELPSSVA